MRSHVSVPVDDVHGAPVAQLTVPLIAAAGDPSVVFANVCVHAASCRTLTAVPSTMIVPVRDVDPGSACAVTVMLPLPVPLLALRLTHVTPFVDAVQLYPAGQLPSVTVCPPAAAPHASDPGVTVHIPDEGSSVTAAAPLIAGFPVLTAVTVALVLAAMLAGAWYKPVDALIVPAPVAGVTLHAAAMLAVNCVLPEACKLCVAGVTTSAAGSSTTIADAITVPPAVCRASTVTVVSDATAAGAVYCPAVVIVPEFAAGFNAHTTGVNPALKLALCAAFSRTDAGVTAALYSSVAITRPPSRMYSRVGGACPQHIAAKKNHAQPATRGHAAIRRPS